jgi:hypothetical protein
MACVLLALAAGRDAQAQAQTTIAVAAGASRQEAGANDLPYLGLPFGGTTAAIVGLIDFPVSGADTFPSASWGIEASIPGAQSGDQSQRTSSATYQFTSRHRDSMFSGVFKIGTPLHSRIHAAFAAGGGAAYRRTAREGTSAPLVPPSTRSDYSAVVSDYVLAWEIGGDLDVRLTERLRILALARWHRLRDDDRDGSGIVVRGVSSHVFRAGVGAAWRF